VADQKKWFKVWTTILLDPDHMNMTLENVGRWTRLGALMVSQGNSGTLLLSPPAKSFMVAMECNTFEAAIDALKVLPNVHIEEGKCDNGKTIVIMNNWFKYQVDSTSYERVKRSRYKRRGEESRVEKSREDKKKPPFNSPLTKFQRPAPEAVTIYAKSIGFDLDGGRFCDYYEAKGWKVGNAPMKNWQAAVRTWKSKREEDNGGKTHDGQGYIDLKALARTAREAKRSRDEVASRVLPPSIPDLEDVQHDSGGSIRGPNP